MISIAEKTHFETRAEFFNALNHTNLGTPNRFVATANFGSITEATTPAREIQLSARPPNLPFAATATHSTTFDVNCVFVFLSIPTARKRPQISTFSPHNFSGQICRSFHPSRAQ